MTRCPTPNTSGRCGCRGNCCSCGFRLHTVVHVESTGGTPGDPPYLHHFVASSDPNRTNQQQQEA